MKKNWKTRLFAGALACMLVLPLTGCSGTKATDLTDGYAKSSEADTDVKGTEDTTLGPIVSCEYNHEITMDFTVRLLQNTLKGNATKGNEQENTLLSPISILAALAMTANGAKGETLAQMEKVFGVSMEALNPEMSAYITSSKEIEELEINIANSIWFKDVKSLSVKEDFIQKNVNYYEADIYAAPFDDSTVDDINNWVKKNTNGMIPSILNQISQDAVMYLINAVAFDAKWQEQYHEYSIRENTFTKEDGTWSTVDFMYSEEYNYLESEDATGFMKPYKGGDYAFVALLPNEGITVEEYVATLDGESLYQMLQSVQKTSVNTSIPKFETEYDIELSDVLVEMGMVDAFVSASADLSGMATSDLGNLYINRVLHKTYICLDENGTKAGAATSVGVNCESALADEPKQVYLNRPFVYMILDTETYKPLFIGTMMDVEE